MGLLLWVVVINGLFVSAFMGEGKGGKEKLHICIWTKKNNNWAGAGRGNGEASSVGSFGSWA